MSESEAKQERKRALETEAEEPHAGEGETSRQHGEEKKIQKAESLDARTTYEVVRREGLRELERSTGALAWSGLAAGLSMGFSFLVEGLLHSHLPDTGWRPLIAKLGYSVGFVIVILGSQQLFTENTLTPIVPLLSHRTSERFRNVMRLWSAVLVTNLIGALLFALVLAKLQVVDPEVHRSLADISARAMRDGFWVTMLHAVYAGWLIAMMVWMIPAAKPQELLLVIFMTYLVGLGGFAHIIAGATEVFYAGFRDLAGWGAVVLGYLVPTLIGNVVGGVTIVAALNHAQATIGE
ncbi:MAG TPA: formate/nitrite transporter family protein [Gemmatimonadaceae bacterium]|nr:formate/nitrite transporter family protein [Gemmatimonadaceae bacterium]